MPGVITIGYEACGRASLPIQVSESSVISDKSAIVPRIQAVYAVFARDIEPQKRDRMLERTIANTVLLDGRDPETQRLLNGRAGVYSRNNGKVYVDANQLGIPSLVEHEIIHLLGETWIWSLPFPRRLVKHHAVAANIAVTLLDKDDFLRKHRLGRAEESDFRRLRWYKLLPIEFQEGIKGFQNTCFRIGNYARESGKGYDLLYRLST